MSLITLYGSMFLLLHGGHVTVTQASCGDGFHAEKKPGKALVGHVKKTVHLDHFECTKVCFAMLKCFSINRYRNESDGRPMCEMNKASRRVNPESFISKPGYEYLEITSCNGDTCTGGADNSYTPIAHWKLDGSDNDVVLKGDAEYRQDGNRNVLYLNGTASWAETPAVDFRTTSFTLAVWIKTPPPESSEIHVPIYDDWSDPWQFAFFLNGSKILHFWGRNAEGQDVWNVHASFLSFDQWTHVGVSVNRDTRKAKIFLNGKKVSSASAGYPSIDMLTNNHTVYDIGLKRDAGFEKTFKGFMKELVIFRRALGEDEMEALKDMPSHMVPWKLQVTRGG